MCWSSLIQTYGHQQTNTDKKQVQVYMHSGVIEGRRACGHGSDGSRQMEGFQGASLLENQMGIHAVCRHHSSLCTLESWHILQQPHPINRVRNPGQLPSVYHQLICAHVPTPLQSCQNTCALHSQYMYNSTSCLYLLFDVCMSISFATEGDHRMVAETFVNNNLWLVQQLNLKYIWPL